MVDKNMTLNMDVRRATASAALTGMVVACLVFAGIPLQAQTELERQIDSTMRDRNDLFDVDRGDSTSAERDSVVDRETAWVPEFLARFRRRDQLGLSDRHFFLSYDRADGAELWAGADIPRSLLPGDRMRAHAGVGYASGSHYWQTAGGVEIDLFSRERPTRVSVEGHIITDTRDAWKSDVVENSLYALVAGGDVREYFQRRGASVGVEQFVHPRASFSIGFRFDRYRSAERTAGWSIFGPAQPFRDVLPVTEGPLRSLVIGGAIDFMSLRSLDQMQVGAAMEAEFGWGTSERTVLPDEPYTMRSMTMDVRLKGTLVERLLWLGLRGRVGATTVDGEPEGVGLGQRSFSLGGTGTLPGYRDNELRGMTMLLLNTELLVQPIRAGFMRNLRVIFSNDFGAVGDGNGSGIFGFAETPLSRFAYSPGVYLGTSTGRIRIGVAWRTDVGAPPRVVVRLAEVF